MEFDKMKVAIFQNTITGGGRMVVVHEIVKILNELGVVPVIYVLRVNSNYTKPQDLRFKVRKLPNIIYGFYELKIVYLNMLMNLFAGKYDLLINSNNSFLFTPKKTHTIAYIHFPRKFRVVLDSYSLGFPDLPFSSTTVFDKMRRLFMRALYKLSAISSSELVIANSSFTKDCIASVYPECTLDNIGVIYPPVSLEKEVQLKENYVLTLGRYCDEKRQLEQIKVAKNCPEVKFRLVGFVGDANSRRYYEECLHYIRVNGIQNVEFYVNVTAEEKRSLLMRAKYFLHTQRNEPFGLAVAEAIVYGCIPVVSDTGGPRELVPYEQLRFRDVEEAVQTVKRLVDEKKSFVDFSFDSQISSFNQDAFGRSFKNVLKDKFIQVNS